MFFSCLEQLLSTFVGPPRPLTIRIVISCCRCCQDELILGSLFLLRVMQAGRQTPSLLHMHPRHDQRDISSLSSCISILFYLFFLHTNSFLPFHPVYQFVSTFLQYSKRETPCPRQGYSRPEEEQRERVLCGDYSVGALHTFCHVILEGRHMPNPG